MAQPSYAPLHGQDYEAYLANEAHAFHIDTEMVRFFVPPERQPQLRGIYVDGQLVTQAQILPLQVQTGYDEVACGGLAGVVTPPQFRRQGYTARLLRHVCDELLSQGTALCLLYPFKTSFYRQYGWATCMERRIYRGSPNLFAEFRPLGSFERVGPEAIGELDAIYRGALRGRFGALVRDTDWWERRLLRDGNKPHEVYLWRDEQGVGRTYVICRFVDSAQHGRRLFCRETVALDPVARSQIFALLRNFDSQCDLVEFRAPADAPVNLLMADPLKCEIEPYFMLRLLDVAQALSGSYPGGVNGRVTLAVRDAWLTHNNGVFALEVSGGQGRCERLPDGSAADVECDVRVLTQIYTRYLRPRTAAAFGLLLTHERAALALLDRLFAGLVPFSSDFF